MEEETREAHDDLDSMLGQLRDAGLLADDASERDKVEALHRYLVRTPAKLLGVALADAVGDRRAINQPGTYDEYPNWRLPLSDGVGQPVLLEDVTTSIRAHSLARTSRTCGEDLRPRHDGARPQVRGRAPSWRGQTDSRRSKNAR